MSKASEAAARWAVVAHLEDDGLWVEMPKEQFIRELEAGYLAGACWLLIQMQEYHYCGSFADFKKDMEALFDDDKTM